LFEHCFSHHFLSIVFKKALGQEPLKGRWFVALSFLLLYGYCLLKKEQVQRDYISPQKLAKKESKGRLLRRSAF